MLKKSLTALLVETKARLHVSAYARNRYPAEFDVQLPVTGRARTSKPSAAADSADGRRRIEGTIACIQPTLPSLRPTIDSAREVVAGVAVAGVVYGSQRTNVDGAIGIQPALSMVCRPEHGRNGMGADGVHQEPGPAFGR